jgi:lipoprotein-anchoring transpeptidase ErfK/SrfK
MLRYRGLGRRVRAWTLVVLAVSVPMGLAAAETTAPAVSIAPAAVVVAAAEAAPVAAQTPSVAGPSVLATTIVPDAKTLADAKAARMIPLEKSIAATATPAPVVASETVSKPKPETTLTINIDLTKQRLVVAERGTTVGTWSISSGADGFRSPTGTFRPLWMSKMWYSKKYDNAPMPHSVFFSGGVALHATQSIGMLGRPASHGCIRQSPANAEKLYKLVSKHGNESTKITVFGDARDYEPRVARRSPNDGPRGQSGASGNGRQFAHLSSPATRRVTLVDAAGNRRIADVSVRDPRLLAYQRRAQQMAPVPRSQYSGYTYPGDRRQTW